MVQSRHRWMRLLASTALALVSNSSSGAQTPQAPEVIVSATRLEDSPARLAVNASVITAEDIARSAARTLPELIGSRAGLVARDLFGNNAVLASIDMRGFGAAAAQNTLVLVDGRALNDIDQSGVQWSSIPLDTIERIEILRGSGAVQYGDGASAGVINIVTRHPARDGNRAGGSIRLGSWDTREVSANWNAFGEQAGFRAFARNYESSGYRDNNHNRQSNFVVNGTWSGSAADASWRISADRQGTRLPGARRVQPSAGVDELATNRRGTSTPLDYAQRDGNQAATDLRWRLGDGELAVGLGYRDKAQRSYFDFSGFPDYRDVDLSVFNLQPRYRWSASAWGSTHTLVAGADFARWDYALLRSNSAANVAQPFNAVSANQDNQAFYVMDTIRLWDGWSVNAGARSERQKITASDAHDPTAPGGAYGSGAPEGSDENRMQAYEAGLRVSIGPEAALIVRAVRSFRFANVDEIYETSPSFSQQFQFLNPQRAKTYEMGLALGREVSWLQASLFHMDVKDEIRLDPFSTGVGNRNMPRSERSGLEVEVRRSIGADLGLFAAYTYTKARFKEGELPGSPFTESDVVISGRTVPLVPRHKADVAAHWRVSEQTSLRAEASYVGEQYMENDEGNTFGRQVPSYTVADLKLQHRVGAFTATLGIANVFDRKYYAYAVRSQFVADRFNAYPLPERSFWVGIAYNGL